MIRFSIVDDAGRVEVILLPLLAQPLKAEVVVIVAFCGNAGGSVVDASTVLRCCFGWAVQNMNLVFGPDEVLAYAN